MGDTRGSSSLFRRAEQVKRWQESETNNDEKNEKLRARKVTFSDGCIFLAAGAAGDKDELLRLLDKGADVNTVNQDGITALHAACIDNNLEMVEFLVDHGADINRSDMEGWTPLHATASCGSCTMAKFLIDRGADLALVNNDGELAIDVVDDDAMARLLQEEMDIRNIDCDASRTQEERQMLDDALKWHGTGKILDVPHPKTGASSLHVASSKGYIKVLRLLLEAGASLNFCDVDGWTSLHAAAHWGQTEAVEILCDNMADMDAVNFVGQTPYDLSDESMKPLMDQLRRRQEDIKKKNVHKHSNKRKSSPKGRERMIKKEREANSDDKVQTTPPQTRLNTSVDEKEVQSWRRASLRNKLPDDKNSKDDLLRTISTPVRTSNKENEDVTLRRVSSFGKDDRNCDSLTTSHRMSEPVISFNATPASRTVGSMLHSSRSFVPPTRDEESETQRKAHAKMVRSTRRSTQGVTLEDLKSAEQLMKTKQPSTAVAAVPGAQENSFSLEDTRAKDKLKSTENDNEADPTTVTIQIRKKNPDDKKAATTDDDKDGEKKTHTREGTQAAIQRKKKPKRRSTGVVHVDMDEIDPERRALKEAEKQQQKQQQQAEDGDDEEEEKAGSEKGDGTKGSNASLTSSTNVTSTSRAASRASSVTTENGDLDYKKLYEEQLVENDRIMDRLRSYEKEVRLSRETMETTTKANNQRMAVAEADKREKRALERKLSEMEEELRVQEQLRQENQRLRDENGALIRVISKLSR